jgi:hypothetical protein
MKSYKLKSPEIPMQCNVCEGFVVTIFNIYIYMQVIYKIRVHIALFCSQIHALCYVFLKC